MLDARYSLALCEFGKRSLGRWLSAYHHNMNDGVNDSDAFTGLALFYPFAYLVVALLCLRHWKSGSPWSDLDYFSGGFFVITTSLLLAEISLKKRLFRSREALREASGLNYDRAMIRWAALLSIIDLLVFLDYAHWHLLQGLRRPVLQGTGFALYACATVALLSTDICLSHHFQRPPADRQLITAGPFAIVRHPRYASLLLGKLGVSLLLASVFAWTSLFASLVLVRRRIRLEETHLREVFGPEYDAYMVGKARLIPGLY
jgi:protein-S-isoprenylcysteine O-methyltransferase Ste14